MAAVYESVELEPAWPVGQPSSCYQGADARAVYSWWAGVTLSGRLVDTGRDDDRDLSTEISAGSGWKDIVERLEAIQAAEKKRIATASHQRRTQGGELA